MRKREIKKRTLERMGAILELFAEEWGHYKDENNDRDQQLRHIENLVGGVLFALDDLKAIDGDGLKG